MLVSSFSRHGRTYSFDNTLTADRLPSRENSIKVNQFISFKMNSKMNNVITIHLEWNILPILPCRLSRLCRQDNPAIEI